MMMHVRPAPERVEAKVLTELRHGFDYVRGSLPIRTALIVLAIVRTMAMPYSVLMPAFVAEALGGGPGTLGMLMTASGAGALLGGAHSVLLPPSSVLCPSPTTSFEAG